MSKAKEIAVIDFSPTLEVPDNAPPLPVDVANATLSFDDIYPENFFSMEGLEQWLSERDAESRVLAVTGASMELLFNPESEKPADGRWLPCLSFKDLDGKPVHTKLVINKSRGMQLRKLTGSPLLADWAKVGIVTIKPGITNGKAQIVIGASKFSQAETQDLMDDLF